MSFTLSQLFDIAFGVKHPVFVTDGVPLPGEVPTYPNVEIRPEEVSNRSTWMGTPVVFPFTLKGGIYKRYNEKAELVDFPLEDFEMPAATLVEFSRAKNIIKTQVLGGKGSVKELYGFDDWRIRIMGMCLTDRSRKTAVTAEEQKQVLLNFDKVCQAVGVVGSLFVEKDIHQIAMGDIVFRQIEGKPEVIPFEITCESDEPLELVL